MNAEDKLRLVPPTPGEKKLADLVAEAIATGFAVDAILAEGMRERLFGPAIRPGGQAETIFGRVAEGNVQYAADEDPNWGTA